MEKDHCISTYNKSKNSQVARHSYRLLLPENSSSVLSATTEKTRVRIRPDQRLNNISESSRDYPTQSFKKQQEISLMSEEEALIRMPIKIENSSIFDVHVDPVRAKNYTQKHYGNVKFGTESRMHMPPKGKTPGPQYYPSRNLKNPTPPAYSLGARRGTSSSYSNAGTPEPIGPGKYASKFDEPLNKGWSFGKEKRNRQESDLGNRNETYDDKRRSCGRQFDSRKRSMPVISFNKATKEQTKKLGVLKNTMANRPASVRIPIPKF